MKKFFGIKEKFHLEWADLTALLSILNVVFIMLGFWYAPFFGLFNCGFAIGWNYNKQMHINFYLTQIAFIILNIYFLI